jgi:tRNA threonylcarbamoyladenosine biosynthesis protein TsaB
MRILAIESSGRESSVAALDGDGDDAQLIKETLLTGRGRTAEALAPTLKGLFDAVGWSAGAIELIAVTVGPGSFTGLRIGVTTAKTLAYAVGADVIGVNTLAVLAEQVADAVGPLWAVIDAQRHELFAAQFRTAGDCPLFSPQTNAPPTSADREKGTVPFRFPVPFPVPLPVCTVDTRIVREAEWLTSLRPGDLVTGPALERLQSQLPAGVDVADERCWQPTAGVVGQVGWRDYQAGRRDDLWKLVPQYYRLSAAEEKQARQAEPAGGNEKT